MTYKELCEWAEYSKLEPFASDRIEIMLAKQMQLYVNSKSEKKFELVDFMITVKRKAKTLAEQISETMKKLKKV